MKIKNKYWFFPLAFMVILSLLIVVAYLLLNHRSTQKIFLSGICERFILPDTDTFTIPKFSTVHVRGFDVSVNSILKGIVSNRKAVVTVNQRVLTIKTNPNRASDQGSCVAEFVGQMGDNSFLVLPEKTTVIGAVVDPSNNPGCMFSIPGRNFAEMNIASEAVKFLELNRLIIDHPDILSHFKNEETLQLNLIPQKSRLINVSFRTQQDSLPKLIGIKFSRGMTPLTASHPLLTLNCPAGRDMNVIGVLNPVLKIDGFDAQRQPKDMPLHVVLKSDSLRMLLTNIVVNEEEKKWYFKIILEGLAHSVQVEGHELVETEFDKIVNGGIKKQGLWGLAILGLTAIIVAIFKRILDNFLAYFFPEPPKKEEKIEPAQQIQPELAKPAVYTKVIEGSHFLQVVELIVLVNEGIPVLKGFSDAELAIVLDSRVIQAASVEAALLDLKLLSKQLPNYTVSVEGNKYVIQKL